MCGIAGIVDLRREHYPALSHALGVMNDLLAHRGPDAEGIWQDERRSIGLAHRRLMVIDTTAAANQPMVAPGVGTLTFNGEIFNYRELRRELESGWMFRTRSDTEVVLAAYRRWGERCVDHLRGMFAFAIWDGDRLFCARDRLGIKPLYHATVDGRFVFASEPKAILPFLDEIETDPDALAEYLVLQSRIGDQTLFRGIRQLEPGHVLSVERGTVRTWRYWDVAYEVGSDRRGKESEQRLREIVEESIALHLRSDVPVGNYLSGGLDSSTVAALASRAGGTSGDLFHGKFSGYPGYDESIHARRVADHIGGCLHEVDIGPSDFVDSIERVLYHLDEPVAGPGAFPQYVVSQLAARNVKVVLGGQGGDEIFGGYVRYLVAYFEQCLRAAIDGAPGGGAPTVTLAELLPNLGVLREYTPLVQSFFADGVFAGFDERYFRLVDRSTDFTDEVDWTQLSRGRVFDRFGEIFNDVKNVGDADYFHKMTHFDLKCLLPGLLQVEDRMSMAHGLESRIPFLDHPLVEFMASVPTDIAFRNGELRHLQRQTFARDLPTSVVERRDKMGFPVPLHHWAHRELREFLNDTFRSPAARSRPFVDSAAVVRHLDSERPFGRRLWALLCLELWQRCFHDRGGWYRSLIDEKSAVAVAASTQPVAGA